MSDAGMKVRMAAIAGDGRGRLIRIIAESFAPGASVAEVARRYGLNSNRN